MQIIRHITIVLTGATGVLGQTVLFELIKRHFAGEIQCKIIILGRGRRATRLSSRIQTILQDNCPSYCGIDEEAMTQFFADHISCIEADLAKESLGLSADDVTLLRTTPIEYVFHMAASVNFMDAVAAQAINVDGTQRLLALVRTWSVMEFIYVSTAFCCGNVSGEVAPDFMPPPSVTHRNPYERSKLQAELAVQSFAAATGIRCRYFRPTAICGQLIENPIGKISAFTGVYLFASIFLRVKLQTLNTLEGIYEKPMQLPLRIFCKDESELNIVPVDYAAKVMCEICFRNIGDNHYHLANTCAMPQKMFMSYVFAALNITDITYVSEMPDNLNFNEKLYYTLQGRMPYLNVAPMYFNVSNIALQSANSKFSCPIIDQHAFMQLMAYGKNKHFAIR